MAATVTPSGVRDGDPDALAALCAARGDAVLAYCQVVAGNAAAPTAAAAAFGRFRAAVVATADLETVNPEALLVEATRQAAARHVDRQAAGTCADVPTLLAARVDRSISMADRERLASHLESCWACRAPVARFKAAERAYRDPPGTPVPADVVDAILAALVAAAPVRGQEPEPAPVPAAGPSPAPAASNGASAFPATEHMPAMAGATEPSARHDATIEYRPVRDEPDAGRHGGERYERRRGARSSRSSSRRDRRGIVAAAIASLGQRLAGRATLGAPPVDSVPEPRVVTGTHLPRPQRDREPTPPGRRAAVATRPASLLPIALIATALVAALLVAGVFNGGDPVASPQSTVPAVESRATGTTPKVVVVPNADRASPAAVELAKRRARAKRRRQAEPASQPAATPAPPTPAPAPAAAADTAPAPPPAPPPPPPPPPPPAADNASKPGRGKGTGSPRVGKGNGATGTDPLPTKDTSTVPELAPPDDTTLPPG